MVAKASTAKEYLTGLDTTVITSPDLSDVWHEQLIMGNTLSKCAHYRSPTGLAYIVDTDEVQLERLGVRNHTQTSIPGEPSIPTTKAEKLTFDMNLQRYYEYTECTTQCLNHLLGWFPALSGALNNIQAFPHNYTAQ